MKRQPLLLSAAAALLCAAGLWWLLAPDNEQSLSSAASGSSVPTLAGTAAVPVSNVSAAASSPADAAAAIYPGSDIFLTADLRARLEEMIFEASGDSEMSDPALLKKRLAELVPRYFSAALSARATALIERYVDYRVALSAIKPPTDPGDPRALRAALETRQSMREKHFAPEEYAALFAEEARLDRYTLARMEIEKNPGLTTAQKQAALKDNESELSVEQRTERSQAVAHIGVATQTAALDAANASDTERYAQRQAQYGNAAALQLAGLDRENRDWQARLGEYAIAQAQKAPPEQLKQLRGRLFTEQEQLRVDAALVLRGQAQPTPR